MTVPDWWLDPLSLTTRREQLSELPDRKLHLLTAAILRRVWDDLPSHHTRLAVEATEKFADRRVTADQLARLRSTDLLESGDGLWLSPDADWDDEQLIYDCGCPCCEARITEYECRVTTSGSGIAGVREGVKDPAGVAAQALLRAREIVGWKAADGGREPAERAEGEDQYALLREIVGPPPHPHWPQWRTADVRTLAKGIHADQDFERLPILADALQDAGCDDRIVLDHCRGKRDHVRGCWVVDLAMGVS